AQPERTAATCKPSPAVYAPGSGTAKRSAPSNTRSSSPAGTCSQPASSTARPAATTSSTATPKKPSAASSNNSKRSATTSHSNRSPLNQHRFSQQVPAKPGAARAPLWRSLRLSGPRRELSDPARSERVVGPEDLAEGAADLADGAANAQRLAHRHQQVRVALGDAAHLGKRGRSGSRVALGADPRGAFPQPALDLRVD